jgi:hypothetical protein
MALTAFAAAGPVAAQDKKPGASSEQVKAIEDRTFTLAVQAAK